MNESQTLSPSTAEIPRDAAGVCPKLTAWAQSTVMLLIRVGFGYQFMLTGWAKLNDVEMFAGRFAEWGIPMPRLNVYMAGGTEMLGGLLLIVGLASRLISIPLAFTMLVAYATAHRDSVVGLFNPAADADGLTERLRNLLDQAPFPFLCAVLVVLAFGPGRASLDHLIKRRWHKN